MTSRELAPSTQASELLECGTSLAEREHRQDDAEKPQQTLPSSGNSLHTVDALRSFIASDIVKGDDAQNGCTMFSSPFEAPPGVVAGANLQVREGRRFLQVPLVYCDQTASNRPLQSIENYMQQVCLSLIGNTHTNTSVTGSQSTAFVAEARQIVAEECNAKITGKASQDVVLFAYVIVCLFSWLEIVWSCKCSLTPPFVFCVCTNIVEMVLLLQWSCSLIVSVSVMPLPTRILAPLSL